MSLKNTLRKVLTKELHPCYFSSGNIVIRCPYCGDSDDKSHAHFSVRIDEEPFIYHCFRCDDAGVFNFKVLKDLNIYNSELMVSIQSMKTKKSKNQVLSFERKMKSFLLPDFSEKNTWKINYIEKRLKIKIQGKDKEKLRIVTSLKEFLKINNITKKYTLYDDSQIDLLDKNYVGFLSRDHSCIHFRNASKNDKLKRWKIFFIYDAPLGDKFYTIKKSIDKLTEKLEVNIAEGVFDIIGLYNYLPRKKNQLFLCANGKSFKKAVNLVLKEGFLDAEFNIYSDSDVNIEFYKKIFESLPISLNIYYNSAASDYGVDKERISLSKLTLF